MDTKKVLIFAGFGIVTLVAAYFIFFPSIKPDHKDPYNPDTDPEPDPDIHKDYTAEKFPLAKGMYGEKIRRVRAVLGLAPSDIFDAELENYLYKKYGTKTISETVYNFYNNKWIEL